jgi:hypothetical protein
MPSKSEFIVWVRIQIREQNKVPDPDPNLDPGLNQTKVNRCDNIGMVLHILTRYSTGTAPKLGPEPNY